MNLSEGLLALPWLLGGLIGYAALVIWAASGIDHWRLRRQPYRQHLLLASSVAVMVLWQIRSDLVAGQSVHVLGMTALTLLVGWRQALVGSLFPVLGSVMSGAEPWQMAGVIGLVLAALPIGVTHAVWTLAERFLPRNLPVYLCVGTLGGSMLAAGLARLVVLGLLLSTGFYTLASFSGTELALLSLTLVPEGIVNVVAVWVLAAWRPQWLMTFQRSLTR